MKKRVISLLLAICLLPGLTPISVRAEENAAGEDEPMAIAAGIPYIDADGSSKTQGSATDVTESTITWNNGWYVVSGNVTVSERITVSGTVNLILGDSCNLKANKGIEVSEGNSLTVYGQAGQTGNLSATGDYHNAGIGGSSGAGGTVIINGGSVNATGGTSGAGIGGGYSCAGGEVTINGGIVKATGNGDGAGIGGGSKGAGGTVTINGGTVTATGGPNGAGIGGGKDSADGGSFSTGTGSNAVIFASSQFREGIADTSK